MYLLQLACPAFSKTGGRYDFCENGWRLSSEAWSSIPSVGDLRLFNFEVQQPIDFQESFAFVPRFKFHFRVTARRGGGYGGGYFFEMQYYDWPLRRAEYDKGYATAGQVPLYHASTLASCRETPAA